MGSFMLRGPHIMPVIIVTTHYICSFSPGLDPRLSNKGAEEKPETMLPYNGCPVTSYLQTLIK